MTPEVIWSEDSGAGAGVGLTGDHRVVKVGNRFHPEIRLPDDAMGGQCWQSTQWGSDWCSKMLSDMLKQKYKPTD